MELKTWLRAEWDRVTGFALVVLGAIVLYAGYDGVGGSAYVAEQLAYLVSGGLGGIFLLGVGATFLIRSDLHDHWRQLDRIETVIREQAGAPAAASEVASNGLAARSMAPVIPESDDVASAGMASAGMAPEATAQDATNGHRAGRRSPLA